MRVARLLSIIRIAALVVAISFCLAAQAFGEARGLRIISLYPGHTDNIIAIGRGAWIVAQSRSDDAQTLAGLPRLPAKVAAEAILAYKPDIVFMRSMNQRENPALERVLKSAGVKVYVIESPAWNEFEAYLKTLCDTLQVNPQKPLLQLLELRKNMRAMVQRQKGKRPKVFLEATGKEIHTCAPDSWAASLIELSGGINAASQASAVKAGSSLAPWGIEKTISVAKEGLDVYLVQQGAMNTATRESVLKRPWFKAVQQARLEFIPESYLSRPSLIGLEKGSRMLFDIFYPGAAK